MSATRTADPVFSLMTAQDPAEAVGSHQRLARAGKGWSVSEVAGKAGVSVPSIEAPESGDGRLRDFVAVSMAMGFGHELWSVTQPFAASPDEQERIEHARMVSRLPQQNLRGVLLAVLLALLVGNSLAQSLVGRVVGVTDGNTVTLLVDGRVQHKIRLSGIDAPEKAQPFGNRAKQRLSSLVYGKTVTAVGTKQDRYCRLIVSNGMDAPTRNCINVPKWKR